ncbi:MAG TPA: hypothetical protein VG265_07615 [Gaiellaceae bacterium]|jgi:hypothetical protein|nr:hypothetical protein [Gaiellaceae bacterium]
MLFTGAWNLVDVVAAGCAGLAAATIAERSRSLVRVDLRPPLERLRAGALSPLVVFSDFALLVRALARSAAQGTVVRGRYVARPFEPGAKTTRSGAAHRAWTTLLGGLSPNAYVVDIDSETHTVLLHDLLPRRRSEEPA